MDGDVVAALVRLAERDGPAELRETHAAWVVLAGDRAFKLKKPVALSFLDYSTVERRRAACQAELSLNRRLAPRTYLGVRAVVQRGEEVELALEDAPGAIDYVVEMRRYADGATLAARLAAGTAEAADIELVGERLARFHASAFVVESSPEDAKRWLDDDFASLHTLIGDEDLRARLVETERFAAAFLGARWSQLAQRAAAGRVRDGHGDLRADHVVIEPGRLEIVDCVEFEPALRGIDVASDLAFLVMDLHAHGRPDLAQTLVAAYRDAGGDPGDDALIAFFAAYRAQVRAKVGLLRAAQLDGEAAADERAAATARLQLAGRFAWEARCPLVIAIAGPSGAGKTTVAAALAHAAGFAQLNSDVVRKRSAGLDPNARAPEELYGTERSLRIYEELGRLAAERARAGQGVIVDATFGRRANRDAFRAGLGEAGHALLHVVECRVPVALLEQRVTRRALDPERVSDATRAVLQAQLREHEPLEEIPAARHLIVRSDRPPAAVLAELADALDRPD